MTKRAPLFATLSDDYLRSVGEMLICALRVQGAINVRSDPSEAWLVRARDLVDEAWRIAEALADGGAGQLVRVTLGDGSTVVADLAHVEGLARQLHRHHAVAGMVSGGAAGAEGRSVAS